MQSTEEKTMNKYNIGQKVTVYGTRGEAKISSIIEQAGFYFYNIDLYGGDQIYRLPENLLSPVE